MQRMLINKRGIVNEKFPFQTGEILYNERVNLLPSLTDMLKPSRLHLFLYVLFLLLPLLSTCTGTELNSHNPFTDLSGGVSNPLGLHQMRQGGIGFSLPGKISTHTATPRPTSTPTPFQPMPPTATSLPPSPTPTATATELPPTQLPDEHFIRNISGHPQYFSLSCEAAVATDWAGYFGVTISEYNFQFELPRSDNPEKGFVGDVNAPWGQIPPYGYGVHAQPVADLLNHYGLPAQAVKGWSVEELKAELADDQPVIAWVIGNVVGGVPYEYTDKEGNTVVVAAYEHVILVTGYSKTHLRYISNGAFYEVPIEVFENSWKVLGNMAIFYDE